jgi:hypothetical protein
MSVCDEDVSDFTGTATASGSADVSDFSGTATASGSADVSNYSSDTTVSEYADVFEFSSASTARGSADVHVTCSESTRDEVCAFSDTHPVLMPVVDKRSEGRHAGHSGTFEINPEAEMDYWMTRRLRSLRSLERRKLEQMQLLDKTVHELASHTYRIKQYFDISVEALTSPHTHAAQAKVSITGLQDALSEYLKIVKKAIDYLDTARHHQDSWNKLRDLEWKQRWDDLVRYAKEKWKPKMLDRHPTGERDFMGANEGSARSCYDTIEVSEASIQKISDKLKRKLDTLCNQWTLATEYLDYLALFSGPGYEKSGHLKSRRSAIHDWNLLLDLKLYSIGRMVTLLDQSTDLCANLSPLIEREWNARWDSLSVKMILRKNSQHHGQVPPPSKSGTDAPTRAPKPDTIAVQLGALRNQLQRMEGKQAEQLLTNKTIQSNLLERVNGLEEMLRTNNRVSMMSDNSDVEDISTYHRPLTPAAVAHERLAQRVQSLRTALNDVIALNRHNMTEVNRTFDILTRSVHRFSERARDCRTSQPGILKGIQDNQEANQALEVTVAAIDSQVNALLTKSNKDGLAIATLLADVNAIRQCLRELHAASTATAHDTAVLNTHPPVSPTCPCTTCATCLGRGVPVHTASSVTTPRTAANDGLPDPVATLKAAAAVGQSSSVSTSRVAANDELPTPSTTSRAAAADGQPGIERTEASIS